MQFPTFLKDDWAQNDIFPQQALQVGALSVSQVAGLGGRV